ncbi:uncharacterized protein G2W53_019864 [Senna tora]|uniref:Uncharacterized protein n=1 Tax=Senna tora TaxID=362788 RepID=A0A834TYZ1_9FABA|nr:uncharacterized protein G2W53_019864 [Senna tora]
MIHMMKMDATIKLISEGGKGNAEMGNSVCKRSYITRAYLAMTHQVGHPHPPNAYHSDESSDGVRALL